MNLELSFSSVLHSGAGYEALKMKRGAMGSSPLTSGGKNRPQRNEALRWDGWYMIEVNKTVSLDIKTDCHIVQTLQSLLGDLNILAIDHQQHHWHHQQHGLPHSRHNTTWSWQLNMILNTDVDWRWKCDNNLCCLHHDECWWTKFKLLLPWIGLNTEQEGRLCDMDRANQAEIAHCSIRN